MARSSWPIWRRCSARSCPPIKSWGWTIWWPTRWTAYDSGATGARLLYLPPYSPDFNPIEPAWSKLKEHFRSAKARTVEVLQEIVAQALRTITPQNASALFAHYGNGLQLLIMSLFSVKGGVVSSSSGPGVEGNRAGAATAAARAGSAGGTFAGC